MIIKSSGWGLRLGGREKKKRKMSKQKVALNL